MKICSIDSCERKHYAKSYCMAHWKRVHKHGSTDNSPILKRVDGFRPCQKSGCSNRFYARGFCEKHYEELKRKENPLYKIWVNMKQRCYNPKHPRYADWGGRGIKVADRWLTSFETFAREVGDRPSPQHSLDRIDNNGGYGPMNVRWATKKEQRANQR